MNDAEQILSDLFVRLSGRMPEVLPPRMAGGSDGKDTETERATDGSVISSPG